MNGTIKIGRHTAGHLKWLADRGYTVTENEGNLNVEVSEFHEKIVVKDAEELGQVLKNVIAKKEALSYSTRVNVGGKVMFGFPLCAALGPASALVMKKTKAAKAKSGFNFNL